MYTGYLLTDHSRDMLRKIFPPKNPTWLGHHITEKFGVPTDFPPPDKPDRVQVVGYIETDGIEGLLVNIDGATDRPSGGNYHITWSIDKSKGMKPFHTNKYIHLAKPVSPIDIDVIPKTFTQSTESEIKKINESFSAFLAFNS